MINKGNILHISTFCNLATDHGCLYYFIFTLATNPTNEIYMITKRKSNINSLVVMTEILKEGAESFHKCYRKGCS